MHLHPFVCTSKRNVTCQYLGKARRLKQAKEEAQAEIESYRRDRERQYKDHENQVCKIHIFIPIYVEASARSGCSLNCT